MANQRVEMGLILILVAMLWAGATAQSSSCTNVLIGLSPCLNYISGNSSTPSSGCCTQLASVVRSQPQCLCEVLNGGASNLGLNINQTQAMALPSACNVQTPPVSQCNAASPAQSPAGSSPGPSGTPSTVPSGRGSSTVPSTNNGSSDAASTKIAIPVLFFLLIASSYLSTCTA